MWNVSDDIAEAALKLYYKKAILFNTNNSKTAKMDWNVNFKKITDEYGSPLYLYDEAKIRKIVKKFKMIKYKPTNIYFATMSNNTPEILKFLHNLEIKLFVNTPKHLIMGFNAGFLPEEIVFTSTNLSQQDMKYAIESKVTLNVDSLNQLKQYCALNAGGEVGLRINLDTLSQFPENHSGVYIGPKSRIGIFESEINTALAIAKDNRVKLTGIHVYLGTNIKEHSIFLEGADEILRIANNFPDLKYIDMGGGFPVRINESEVEFDYERFGEEISRRMDNFSKNTGRKIELAFEPGRALLSDAAVFITKVTDIKERNAHIYVGVDSSVDIFPRPLYYDVCSEAYHPVFVYGKKDIIKDKLVSICGSTTYSRDYLAKDRHLPLIEIDDVLVFENAGSYCSSAYSDFLGKLRPTELMMKNGEILVLKEGEKLLFQNC